MSFFSFKLLPLVLIIGKSNTCIEEEINMGKERRKKNMGIIITDALLNASI